MKALIWSIEHGRWWAPGRCGYVDDWRDAGRYTEDEAKAICEDANAYRAGSPPNEAIVPIPKEWEDGLKRKTHRKEPLTASEANKLYKGHSLHVMDRKDGKAICYCCGEPSTGRSSMNIWGAVVDFQTCLSCHAEFDGMRADSIPTKDQTDT